jgi:protein-tyrosine phosphatase
MGEQHMPDRPALLFVCTGNICRSPMAEGAFRAAASRIGLEADADSAGLGGWHVGDPPDSRARAVARRGGVDIDGLRARQVGAADFGRFDLILALDRGHLRALERMRPAGARAALSLLLDHAPGREGGEVADPYYGDLADFEQVWAEVTEAARHLAAAFSRPR